MRLVKHERKNDSARDDYETPPKLYNLLNEVYNFDLDVCADIKTTKCLKWFGVKEDGLKQEWSVRGSTVFCNPPFSNWPAWMRKAVNETANGVTTVFLVPPRTGTKAWHLYAPYAHEIIFLEGRVSFLLDKVPQKNNGADSVLLIFRPNLPNVNYSPIMTFWNWKE